MSSAIPQEDIGSLPQILVVDDDDRIRDLVIRFLKEHGFFAVAAADAGEAEKLLKAFTFDALVVDVMMPGKTGYEFVQDLRVASDVPVIMLTALGEMEDKASGFDAGADDYLPKPFDPKELVMRLNAILKRRPKEVELSGPVTIGDWVFYSEAKEIVREGETVRLTDVEVTLLDQLRKKANQILSREALARLCGIDAGERTIDVQVTRLRRKIEIDSKNPRYLQTIRGKGYILRIE